MLRILLLLYRMAMAHDVRSPMPHIVGPPGTGKSTVMQQLADLLGVALHIISVARMMPTEVEGVQMPVGSGEDMVLKMLPATYWTSLKEGDIVFFDEFLRGYEMIYNALLDIFTSRRVGAHRLPKVVIMGASNSVKSYDPALDNRLLHIPVPDARRSKAEQGRIAQLIVDEIGLLPSVATSDEMEYLIEKQILPAYEILDVFKKKGKRVVDGEYEGSSARHLIGQAQLRYIVAHELRALIDHNNMEAGRRGLWQYVVLANGHKFAPAGYEAAAQKLVGNPRLTPLQAINLELNLEMLEMARAEEEAE